MRKRVSRRLVFLRDKNTCQYCGRHKSEFKKKEHLTIEHIKPKSFGGKTTWDNVVAACNTCNKRKGNRLPVKAGMRLISPKAPREPRYLAVMLLESADEDQRRWLEMLVK